MSVLTRIRDVYLQQQAQEEEFDVTILAHVRRGGKAHGSGNPTGSAVGKCTAQLQMLRYPDISKPEPFPLRSKMVMENGHLIEAWWAAAIEAAFPNKSGLANEVFYFPVPLDAADTTKLLKKAPEAYKKRKPGQWWGEVSVDFKPPSIKVTEGNRAKLSHLIERDPRTIKMREATIAALPAGLYTEARKAGLPMAMVDAALGIPSIRPRPVGFVLDTVAKIMWCPTYVDRILFHPEHGITCLEKKAVSNFAFRRAVLGEIDFEKRAQMVTFVEATKLPVAWLFYRKETAHLLEIFYSPSNEGVKITFTKSNGTQEVYYKDGKMLKPAVEGQEPKRPEDISERDWELCETWSPYDTGMLEIIQENVRRVLLAEPGEWMRRYGPSFLCKTCYGTKMQTMQKGKSTPLKTPKPCEDCAQTGLVDRATLGFPCSYCPTIQHCWGPAGLELEVTDKPKFWVTRKAFQESKIVVTPFGAKEEERVEEDPPFDAGQ